MKIKIIDIEASGLHIDSYPIEIAIHLGNRVVSWLIKPLKSWRHWCAEAESLHGITRGFLNEKGEHPKQVALQINEVLKESDGILYSDAKYWDTNWFNVLFEDTLTDTHCNIKSIFDLFENQQADILKSTLDQLSKSGKYKIHRAGEDVKMIKEAFDTTYKRN